jgi:hypothetical protein
LRNVTSVDLLLARAEFYVGSKPSNQLLIDDLTSALRATVDVYRHRSTGKS